MGRRAACRAKEKEDVPEPIRHLCDHPSLHATVMSFGEQWLWLPIRFPSLIHVPLLASSILEPCRDGDSGRHSSHSNQVEQHSTKVIQGGQQKARIGCVVKGLVMVNFMCQFDGAQIFGKRLFWVCLCGCFWM